MTKELPEAEWESFFYSVSRSFLNWEATVHLLSRRNGAQVLSEKLPFNGLKLGEKDGYRTIELLIGSATAGSQIHQIFRPAKVAFAERGHGPAGTLDIEDAAGNTTLITFLHPRRFLAEHASGNATALSR